MQALVALQPRHAEQHHLIGADPRACAQPRPVGRRREAVAGAQIDYEGATDTVMKGLLEIAAGDEIDFLCDFYTYDGVYSDSYYLGERMIATGEWVIGNAPIGSSHTRMTYCLTDIYGAQYWTPPVS